MGKKSKAQRQRDSARARARAEQQRRAAAMEEFTEEHAQVVAQRHGDPRFVQRRRRADGSVEVSWAAGSELDVRTREAMEGQRAAFEEKFGRPPGPHDPVFFDPQADEPRPLTQDAVHRVMDEMWEAADRSGVDPAFVHAWRECGYLVTEDNRHTFSAAEVMAFSDAVHAYRSAQGEPDAEEADGSTGEDLGETDDRAAAVAGLREVVAAIMVRRDPRIALRVVVGLERVAEEAGDEAAGLAGAMSFGVLAGWLTGARDAGLPPAQAKAATAWVDEHLGARASESASRMAGMIGAPGAGDVTVAEVAEDLGDDLLPAMIWLTCGVVAVAGAGDAGWLEQFDLDGF
ncbi:hypothetical protein OHA74_52950 [Streptomyces phaeochromogenes]|uniref:hypothetical protein n=1 Tax=Streptomyces phaeochromogenes TaxID=1923 RepID=UPI002E2B166E|nr:hypothetical protein [Streptomyces phaeochromogenes]